MKGPKPLTWEDRTVWNDFRAKEERDVYGPYSLGKSYIVNINTFLYNVIEESSVRLYKYFRDFELQIYCVKFLYRKKLDWLLEELKII